MERHKEMAAKTQEGRKGINVKHKTEPIEHGCCAYKSVECHTDSL